MSQLNIFGYTEETQVIKSNFPRLYSEIRVAVLKGGDTAWTDSRSWTGFGVRVHW